MAFWDRKLKAEMVLENKLQKQANTEIVSLSDEDSLSLPLTLKEKITTALECFTKEKGVRVLSLLVTAEDMSVDIAKFINRETTYIARIPKKLDEEMKNGLLSFMTDKKTGENLGMLIDSKHRTRGYMRIDEIKRMELSSNLANIATQQQLANMTEVINDVRTRVMALQEGHDADLFGSIKGMHQQLLQMRDAINSDTKNQLATQAITVLNDTRGKIEATILTILKDIDVVPTTDREVLLKIAKNKNFLSDTIEKYNRIEELFRYYITATQFLGYAYAFLDEPRSFEDIFKPSTDIIDNGNLQKLVLAENLFNERIGETWYKNPEDFLLRIKNASQTLFANNDDIVEIEISGEKLLEVIENESKSNETNSEKEVSDS